MDETQAAPPTDSQQPVAPPPTEQAAPTTAPEPGQDPNLLRAFTQGQQKLSSILGFLGLPKTATAEQVISAIDTRRKALVAADDELSSDPRVAQRQAALDQRERTIAKQQFGDSADLTATIIESLRAGGSILELTEIVDTHVLEAAARKYGGSPAQAGGAPDAQAQAQATPQQAPERELDMEYRGNAGMRDPGITPDRSAGPVGFFKDLRAKALGGQPR